MAAGGDAGAEFVDGEAALFLAFDEAGVFEDTEVVGGDHDLDAEDFGDFADVAGSITKRVDDSEPQRFREGFEKFCAMVRLETVSHRIRPT